MSATIPYYTVEDLEQFPNDGNRYELLDGVLVARTRCIRAVYADRRLTFSRITRGWRSHRNLPSVQRTAGCSR